MQPSTSAGGTSLAEQIAGLSSSVRERLLSKAVRQMESLLELVVKPSAEAQSVSLPVKVKQETTLHHSAHIGLRLGYMGTGDRHCAASQAWRT